MKENGPEFPFNSLETVQLGPAIPSTFVSLPLHAVANQEVVCDFPLYNVEQLSLSLSPSSSSYIIPSESSLPMNLSSQHSVKSRPMKESSSREKSRVRQTNNLIKTLIFSLTDITLNICCIGTGRVELVGCLFVGTESFQSLNGTYETLGPFYFGYDCLSPCMYHSYAYFFIHIHIT